jgi:hypothetical protein
MVHRISQITRKLEACAPGSAASSGDLEMSMGAACARQEGRSSALQRLEKRQSPQAACLC